MRMAQVESWTDLLLLAYPDLVKCYRFQQEGNHVTSMLIISSSSSRFNNSTFKELGVVFGASLMNGSHGKSRRALYTAQQASLLLLLLIETLLRLMDMSLSTRTTLNIAQRESDGVCSANRSKKQDIKYVLSWIENAATMNLYSELDSLI
jgi:hypothetical protein